MRDDMRLSQTSVDMLLLLLDHQGMSSKELSLISGLNRNGIKGYMRLFETLGYGTYSIRDGAYFFWFSPDGRKIAQEYKDDA